MAKTKDKLEDQVSSLKYAQENENREFIESVTSPFDEGQTRHEVAKLFAQFYFFIIVLIFIGVLIFNYLSYRSFKDPAILVPLKDILLTYAAIIGPTLGLVIAYYFENKK